MLLESRPARPDLRFVLEMTTGTVASGFGFGLLVGGLAVPEPSTAPMVVLGLAALARWRRGESWRRSS